MKKKLLPLLLVPTLLLSACSFFSRDEETYNTYEKEIGVYNIDSLNEEKELSSGFQKSIKARFIENESLIPYLSLSQYASLYEAHFASDAKSEVSSGFFSDIWTVYVGDQPCFITQINYLLEEVIVAGSLQAAYKEDDDPRDLKALEYGLKNDADGKYLSSTNYSTFYFDSYGIKQFTYSGDRYYPLGFLDTTFIDSSARYFTYNYSHILSTVDVDNYSVVEYKDGDQFYTFDSQMEKVANEYTLPSYLLNYNSGIFLYMMDNFYGLRNQKKISSFASFYKKHGLYSGLFSKDSQTRGLAFSDACSFLDDNHTVFVSANKSWGEDQYGLIRRYGDGCIARSQTKSTLQDHRQNITGDKKAKVDPVYSQDGKTAVVAFDSFEFGSSRDVFNEDDSIKETAKEHDTFFRLISAFNEIKSKNPVQNVVLDISLNGGGVLGVMLKLLALISKNNSSQVVLYQEPSTQAVIYNPHVDINNDGKYDLEDCFGDDFNIYILASDCSFSCGNAFPCAAQLHGDAKIIGQKSGGGECVVSVHYLPNSEYVYHSGNIHIGALDKSQKEFIGFENGATPDIEIEIGANFYSVEYLNTLIQNAH